MSNRKKLADEKPMHAKLAGTDRSLCSRKKSQRTTDDPAAVTCRECGKAALRYVKAAEAEAAERHESSVLGRQAAALAGAQPARWWEAGQTPARPGDGG